MILQWLSNNWICVLLALGCGYIGGVGYRYWVETTRVAKEAFEAELQRKRAQEMLKMGWKETAEFSNFKIKELREMENEKN